jgi:hypothetical protein
LRVVGQIVVVEDLSAWVPCRQRAGLHQRVHQQYSTPGVWDSNMPGARLGPAESPSVRSSSAAISSAEIPPGRSTWGGSAVQSTIVDSTPTGTVRRRARSPRHRPDRRAHARRWSDSLTEPVCGWRGQSAAEPGQQLQRHRMCGYPNTDSSKPARDLVEHRAAAARATSGSGPAGICKHRRRGGIVAAHSPSRSAPAM